MSYKEAVSQFLRRVYEKDIELTTAYESSPLKVDSNYLDSKLTEL